MAEEEEEPCDEESPLLLFFGTMIISSSSEISIRTRFFSFLLSALEADADAEEEGGLEEVPDDSFRRAAIALL